MNKIVALTSLGVATSLMQGCVILFNLPATRFESPEAQGGWGHFHVDGGLGGSTSATVSQDSTNQFADTGNPRLGSEPSHFRFQGEFGLLERLDLSVHGSLATSEPFFLKAKYQLLGSPRTTAEPGNISLAVSAGIGGLTLANGGDNTAAAGYYRLGLAGLDTAMIGGYRATSWLLAYTSTFATFYSYGGSQTVTGAAQADFRGNARVLGANLGVQVGGDPFSAKIEVAQTYTTVDQAGFTRPYLGVALSLAF